MEKVKLTKEQILNTWNKVANVQELCKILNVSYSIIYTRCKEYGINLNNKKRKWNIDKDKFLELYESGYNDREIGEILNIPGKRICDYRTKLQLPVKNKITFQLTPDQYQIFIGGMYGDSCLIIPKENKNAKLTFRHSLKQKEYCLWKYEQLKEFCFKPYEISEFDSRTNKTYDGITIVTKQNEYFTKYYDKFYHNIDGKNVKYINSEILSTLEPLGLAIWFQDDGSKNPNGGYYIATNCFTVQEIELIRNFLLFKFQLQTTIHKDNLLYITAKSKQHFKELIEPYIQECCKYKLH